MISALQPEFLQLQNNLKFGNGLFGYIEMGTHILAHSSFSHWKEQYFIKAQILVYTPNFET
jgi:hypothetical protein